MEELAASESRSNSESRSPPKRVPDDDELDEPLQVIFAEHPEESTNENKPSSPEPLTSEHEVSREPDFQI